MRTMSAIDASPPDAITGIETASASSIVTFPVDAGQNAIAVDVGVDDRRNTGAFEAAQPVRCCRVRRPRPNPRRQPCRPWHRCRPATRSGTGLAGLAHQIGIAHCNGAQNDPGKALASSQRSIWANRANAAAELDRVLRRLQDRLTAAPLTDWPSKAPLRSTTCSHSNP
jgi:hypothetical protein